MKRNSLLIKRNVHKNVWEIAQTLTEYSVNVCYRHNPGNVIFMYVENKAYEIDWLDDMSSFFILNIGKIR